MKALKTNGMETFTEVTVEPKGEGFVKVKLHYILPTYADADVFRGRGKHYPVVPCHMATAYVSEDYPEYGLKQGTKVLLSPYVTDQSSLDNKVNGFTEDGFLANFVELPESQVIPLPDDVKEIEAVFADYIAISYETVKRMNLVRGDYVAIIGGGAVTNILAQLVLYYQAVPILIHNREDALKRASDAGVYYTVNAQEVSPYEAVREITGGRMAEHVALAAAADVSANYLLKLAKNGGNCFIIAPHGNFSKLDADLAEIYRRNLTVSGVSSGRDDITSAVNILAQKFLKLDNFVDRLLPVERAELLFREFTENPGEYFCRMLEVLPSSFREQPKE